MEGVSSFFNEAESTLKCPEKEGYQSTNTSAAYLGPSQLMEITLFLVTKTTDCEQK